MPTGKHYYWDSCVFISLLTLNNRTDEEVSNLRALEALSDEGQITILTSAITKIEVLDCHLTAEQENMFQGMLERSNIEVVSLTSRIASLAREIRTAYEGKVAVPDAIHLATAIFYNSTAFHTYDGCGRKSKHTDLLKLETPILGKYPLTISKPEPEISEEPPMSANEPKPVSGDLFDILGSA
jgi:predicted nucleic acid-binding protein